MEFASVSIAALVERRTAAVTGSPPRNSDLKFRVIGGSGSPLDYAFLETLVDDRSIRWQQDTVQVDDLSIHNQLDVDGFSPVSLRILPVSDRDLTLWRRMDADPSILLISKPKAGTAPQNDGSAIRFDLK